MSVGVLMLLLVNAIPDAIAIGSLEPVLSGPEGPGKGGDFGHGAWG